MKRTAFNDGWTFYRDGSSHGERVTLPHDAMIHAPRSAEAPSTGEQGNFEGGTYRYEKRFVAPDVPGRTMLQFGGVYRHAKVTLNGHEIGSCAYELPPISWTREMGGSFMSDCTMHDEGARRRAAELFGEGLGYKAVAGLLRISRSTVRKWLYTYRSVGVEGLMVMGSRHSAYSFETKVAAARAVADEGASVAEAMSRFGVVSTTAMRRWVKAYREGGEEALRPRPKGRPRGSGGGPRELTREQELERQVQRLEAEVAYLKKSIALKAEKRSRTARRRRP